MAAISPQSSHLQLAEINFLYGRILEKRLCKLINRTENLVYLIESKTRRSKKSMKVRKGSIDKYTMGPRSVQMEPLDCESQERVLLMVLCGDLFTRCLDLWDF